MVCTINSCFSYACSIEEEEEVIITGGSYSLTKVTSYRMNGESTSLPDLNTGRDLHACGRFTNSEGATVGKNKNHK